MVHEINEVSKIYGPWKVVRRIYSNNKGNGWVRYECICQNCGEHYTAPGARFRQNLYRKQCPNCGDMG